MADDELPTEPEGPHADSTAEYDPSTPHGGRIGPYRLLECVGVGGMGEVWRAEQTAPVRRVVALKLIKAGMDSRNVLARFEAERQALALMEHPCIAQVYDAGTTEDGRPYFAMEYVRGIPISNYCDQRRLSTEERLRLFQRVCDGVQHAHQKAVMHRDLKPSNILVADIDGKPRPKIIDFGVAKALTLKLTEETMFTAIGELIGTPEYMSPEQAEITREDVDTRTDVYSLGVILYELLVGALPFDTGELRRAGFLGIVKMLREKEPLIPSARLSTLGDRTTQIAMYRRTEPHRLGNEIRGDLDWIVMHALEKDRNRRYGSPREFSEDITRHLRHEPAVAGPPEFSYRARKFVRRHRVAVGAVTASFLVLAIFAVTVALQSRRISRERDQTALEAATANRVSEFLVDLFDLADPRERRGKEVTVRELLDEGAARIDRELSEDPELQARLMEVMGRVYLNLDAYEQAGLLFQQALDRAEGISPTAQASRANLLRGLAAVRVHSDRYAEAESLYTLALKTRERLQGPESPEAAELLGFLGVLARYQADYPRADSLYQRALSVSLKYEDGKTRAVADILNNMSVNYWYMGRLDDAEDAMLRCLALRREILPPDDPSLAESLNNLGALNQKRKNYDAAVDFYTQAVELRERVYGESHSEIAQTLYNIASMHSEKGEYEEARDVFERTLRIYREIHGEEHHLIAHGLYGIGRTWLREGDLDQAERYLLEAKAMHERRRRPDHLRVGQVARALGELYGRRGDRERADAYFSEALRIIEGELGKENEDYAEALALRDRWGTPGG